MMKPDPKLFVYGKMRTSRPMVMRRGSANVLTLHEGVGLAADREKGLTASARRLDLEAQFNASGYSIVGLQETRCIREGDRRGRHYNMIGTAASHVGQGGCELWITTKLNPVKSSTIAAHSHRWRSMLSCQIFLLPLSLPTHHQRLPMNLSRSNGGKSSRRLFCAWLRDVSRFGCS